MKNLNTLNEELNRMKTLMSFDITNNSLDYLIEQEEKIYKSKGDPYEYKLVDGVWYTKGLKIKDWKSLKGNRKAIDTLNKRYPEAMSKSTTDSKDTKTNTDIKTTTSTTDSKDTKTTTSTTDSKDTKNLTGGGGSPTFDIESETVKVMNPLKKSVLKILSDWKNYNNGLKGMNARVLGKGQVKKEIEKSEGIISSMDPKDFCSDSTMSKIESSKKDLEKAEKDYGNVLTKEDKNYISSLKEKMNLLKSECQRLKKELEKNKEKTTSLDKKVSTDTEEVVTTTDTKKDGEEEVTTTDTDTEEVDYSSDVPMGRQIDKNEFKDEFKKVRQDYRANKRKYKIQNKECVKHIKGLYNVMKKLGLQGTGSSEEKLNNFKEKQQDEIIRADWCIAHYQNRLKKENLLGVGTDDKLRYIYDVLKEDMPSQVTTRKEGQKYTIYRNPKDQTGKIAVIKYIGNGQYQFSGGKLLLDTSNKNKTEFNKSYIDSIRNQLGLESSEKITIRPKGLKRLGNKTNGKFQVS